MGLACQCQTRPLMTQVPTWREPVPTWFLRIADILRGHNRTWTLEGAEGVALERRWCHLGLPEDGTTLQMPPATERQIELNNR